jgi:hypothetical protein
MFEEDSGRIIDKQIVRKMSKCPILWSLATLEDRAFEIKQHKK